MLTGGVQLFGLLCFAAWRGWLARVRLDGGR
jgi:hypothetical protein